MVSAENGNICHDSYDDKLLRHATLSGLSASVNTRQAGTTCLAHKIWDVDNDTTTNSSGVHKVSPQLSCTSLNTTVFNNVNSKRRLHADPIQPD